MITIIASTNREGSKTQIVANKVREIVVEKFENVHLLDLAELDWQELTQFDYENVPEFISSVTIKYFVPVRQFVFVVPEYNGSFPGILKLFIDMASIVDYKGLFTGCSIHLIGVSDGRAGNLRGLDQLSSILRHMGAKTIHKSMPISSVGNELMEGQLSPKLKKSLRNYLNTLNI